ncbi:SAM-dependent methyltransferase [Gammaproteobacteria bacterium]|nr:SAM-dependent methyltransferase [Gammaproteobacteria bacterium]
MSVNNLCQSQSLESLLVDGPVNFAAYMEHALYHPNYGYYGASADYLQDFITAPIHANYLAKAVTNWLLSQHLNHVAELGPGLGHLALEIQKNHYGLKRYYLVDRSNALRKHQQQNLTHAVYSHISTLDCAQPTVVIANEVLDALPTRRFRYHKQQIQEWFLDQNYQETWQNYDDLCEQIKAYSKQWPQGYEFAITDYVPILKQLERSTADHALWIDYGHESETYFHPSRPFSCVKYIKAHQHVAFDPKAIGNVDISASVNWTAFITAAKQVGFSVERFGSLAGFMCYYQAYSDIDISNISTRYQLKETMIPGGLGETMQVLWLKRDTGIV